MWEHIFSYGNTRFCLCQDTGTMNRSPTPGGMKCGIFRGQTWHCWQTTTPKIIDITTVMLCAKNNTEHKKTHFGKTKTNKRIIKNRYTISSLLSIDSTVFTILYKKSTIK